MVFDEIWRMQRRQRSLLKHYRRQEDELSKDHTEEQIDSILHDLQSAVGELGVRIAIGESDALVEIAHRLKVPLAPLLDKESWEDFYGPPVLKAHAYATLRSAIRQEQKERRDAAIALIKDIISPIGGIIISIVSLLIAYAALKLKH